MFMTTVYAHTCHTSILFLYQQFPYFLLYVHYSKWPIQKSRQKKARNQFDCGPTFLPTGRPGLDECHFFLGVIELIEPGLDIFLLPNFFWGKFFFAIIAEKPQTQPDLSGEAQR